MFGETELLDEHTVEIRVRSGKTRLAARGVVAANKTAMIKALAELCMLLDIPFEPQPAPRRGLWRWLFGK